MSIKRSMALRGILILLSFVMIGAVAKIKSIIFERNRNFTVSLESVDTVIIGDSLTRYAFDTEQIPCSINVAQTSENIMFSYFVIQKILQDNPNVRRLVIGLSYHSLGAPFAHFEPNEMLRRYHLLLPREFYREVFAHEGYIGPYLTQLAIDHGTVPLGVANDIYEFLMLKSGMLTNFPYIGRFVRLSGSRISTRSLLNKTILRHYYFKGKQVRCSKLKMKYISRIIQLCRNRGVKVIFVTPPLHPEYYKRIPSSIICSFQKYMKSLVRTSEIRYIDFSQMKLNHDEYYEYDHLNGMGAVRFSRAFGRLIQ